MSEEFVMQYPQTEESANSKYENIPDGIYFVKIAEVRPKMHARGPMFGLKLRVTEDVTHDNKYMGRVVWGNVIFLPYFSDAEKKVVTKGAGIARSFLKAIGHEYKGETVRVFPKKWIDSAMGIIVATRGDRQSVGHFMDQEEYLNLLKNPKKDQPATALKEEDIF